MWRPPRGVIRTGAWFLVLRDVSVADTDQLAERLQPRRRHVVAAARQVDALAHHARVPPRRDLLGAGHAAEANVDVVRLRGARLGDRGTYPRLVRGGIAVVCACAGLGVEASALRENIALCFVAVPESIHYKFVLPDLYDLYFDNQGAHRDGATSVEGVLREGLRKQSGRHAAAWLCADRTRIPLELGRASLPRHRCSLVRHGPAACRRSKSAPHVHP